jgi:hypothetical protein
METVEAASRGEEVSAYSRYFERTIDGEVVWNRGVPFAPVSLSPRVKRVLAAVAIVTVGVVVTAVGIVTANPFLIIGGLALVAVGVAILVVDSLTRDESNTIVNMPEIAARKIEDNIEFCTADEDENEHNVIRLAFRYVDDEGNFGDLHFVKDKSGRQLYYNKVTRFVGNARYCVLNYSDLSLLRLSRETNKIRTDTGYVMVVFEYVRENDPDTMGYFKHLPEPAEPVYYVLGSGDFRAVVSFFNKAELSAQVANKSVFSQLYLDKLMVSIHDIEGQSNYDKNKVAREDFFNNVWTDVGNSIRDFFGFGTDGHGFTLRSLINWAIIIGIVILGAIALFFLAKLLISLFLIKKGF